MIKRLVLKDGMEINYKEGIVIIDNDDIRDYEIDMDIEKVIVLESNDGIRRYKEIIDIENKRYIFIDGYDNKIDYIDIEIIE